jgi:hypothetical protein
VDHRFIPDDGEQANRERQQADQQQDAILQHRGKARKILWNVNNKVFW